MIAKKRYWIPAGLILWLIIVLAKAPASWAMALLQQAEPSWQVTEPSGSFWRGRVQTAQLNVNEQALGLGQFDWQISPLSLLIFKPCIQFTAQRGPQAITGEACFSLFSDSVSIRDVQAKLLVETLEPWLLVKLDGEGLIDIRELKANKDQITTLQGNLKWNNARAHNGNTWVALGNLNAALDDDQQGGLVTQWFAETGGPLATDIKIQLPLTGGILMKGTITPANTADPAIYQALNMVGQPIGDGRYEIEYAN